MPKSPIKPVDTQGKLLLSDLEHTVISALASGEHPKRIRAETGQSEGAFRRTLLRVRRRWDARTTHQLCAMYGQTLVQKEPSDENPPRD